MNKLLVALIAGAFAMAAGAQNPVTHPSEKTKQKQQDVRSVTQQESDTGSTQKTEAEQRANVKKSKETAKMSHAEKKAFAKDATKMNVNPNTDAGTAATAAQQKANVAKSKATPKQNTELKTKEGQKQLSKDLQEHSTAGGK